MKLVTFIEKGREFAGILSKDGSEVYSFEKLQQPFQTVEEAVKGMSEADIRALSSLCDMVKGQGIPYEKVTKCAPIPRPSQDVICLGINYMAHAE